MAYSKHLLTFFFEPSLGKELLKKMLESKKYETGIAKNTYSVSTAERMKSERNMVDEESSDFMWLDKKKYINTEI